MRCQFKCVVRQRGFTVLELLIAALIASFVILAAMKQFINQSKNHLIQAGITNMQQNGRATVDELVGKIRQAGYRLEPGMTALRSWNSNPDTIALVFLKEPICTATISNPMPVPSAELKCIGSDISCFETDTWAYIYDPVTNSGEFFFITQVQDASMHIQHNLASLSKCYQPGAKIFMLDFYKYYIDNTDSLHPQFVMEKNGNPPVVFADDIVDLQFRYRLASGSIYDTIIHDRYVREVEIGVVARTERSDLFLHDYRYDTLRSSAMVRNLSM